jgi:hypothetical protein
VLYLPGGLQAPGFLIFSCMPGGRKVTVGLSAALVRPIAALHAAMRQDADVVAPARGWRRPAVLAEAIAEMDPLLLATTAQTVRAYICRIKGLIRQAMAEQGAAGELALFEQRRGLGVRLAAVNLVIADRTQRRRGAGGPFGRGSTQASTPACSPAARWASAEGCP